MSKYLLPLLVSVVAATGVVALFGGITMWSRFLVAEVPPEQAVEAIPDKELVVFGAVAMILLGVAGLLVMTAAYVLDKGGRQTKAVARSLLALAVLGGLLTCITAEQGGLRAWLAVAAVVGGGAVVFWFFERDWSTSVTNDLEFLEGEERMPEWERPSLKRTPRTEKEKAEKKADEERARNRYTWTRSTPDYAPERFRLSGLGRGAVAGVAAVCAVGVWLSLGELELGFAIMLAVALVWGSYAVANSTGATFVWYGVSVFISVIVFGAYLSLVDISVHKRVQPVAIVRTGDEQGQGVLGFYVTENGERLYAATVGMGCDGTRFRKDSGQLFWIAKGDIRAVAIGRLQDPEDAVGQPADMLRALWAARLPVEKEKEDSDRPGEAQERAKKPGKDNVEPAEDANAGPGEDDLPALTPAVRYTPRIDDIAGAASDGTAKPGQIVRVEGSEFGRRPVVTVGGTRIPEISPKSLREGATHFTFVVPRRAESGRVEIRCGEAADQQALSVEQAPIPVVRGWRVGRDKLKLSARRSRDRDGEVVNYYWKLSGRDRIGDRITIRARRGETLPQVVLKVTDDEGLTAKATVQARIRRGRVDVSTEPVSP